jgi:primase-polymerase (primpol)-like protein
MPLVPYQCSQCGTETAERGRAKGMCKSCYHRTARLRWSSANRERERLKTAEYHAANRERRNRQVTERRRQMRAQILETLGARCNCCGETEPAFLTIDHILNDGAKVRHLHRHKIYRMILEEGCPTDRYQILCWNCNSAKGMLGHCPHSVPSSTKTS